uniref:PTS sugar transporter subunit IIC n=1 Tax=Candidatus Enterococcus willemsii TaxID=1857215 RepID=UPI00403F1089
MGGEFAQKLNKSVTKFSSNIIVKTIAAGMARLLPVTMIGSLATLLISFPFTPWTDFITNTGLIRIFSIGSQMTNDIISIYLVVVLAYDMSRLLKSNQINSILVAVISFFVVTPMTPALIEESTVNVFTTTYLGSRGMFVGIVISLLATYIFYVISEKGLKIRMPAAVPPAISASFEALIPAVGTVVVFISLNVLVGMTSWGDVHTMIYALLQAPLEGLGGSIWTMVFLALLGEFFWFFGIHGSNVTSAVNNTLFMPSAIENASNVASGLPATKVVNSYFLDAFKGPRHTVLSAMLFFLPKSKRLKAIGKVSVIPGIFGISEPMKFGIPMVLNPIILVPMSLAPVISLLIAYFAIEIGFMRIISVAVPWTMPPILSGFIVAGWQGVVVQIIQMFAIFTLYIPFFKYLDRRYVVEEELQEKTVKEEK